MMAIAYQLHCDGVNCTAFYPPNGSADGAIFSPADVRGMAKKVGWKRDRAAEKDYCFYCAHGAPSTKKGKAA